MGTIRLTSMVRAERGEWISYDLRHAKIDTFSLPGFYFFAVISKNSPPCFQNLRTRLRGNSFQTSR